MPLKCYKKLKGLDYFILRALCCLYLSPNSETVSAISESDNSVKLKLNISLAASISYPAALSTKDGSFVIALQPSPFVS